MVIPALIISSAVVILFLGALAAGKQQMNEMGRQKLERFLGDHLEAAKATSPSLGTGKYDGMDVSVDVQHHYVEYTVQLEDVGVPYAELLTKYGSPELQAKLEGVGLSIDKNDRLVGRIPDEPDLGDKVAAVGGRVLLASEAQGLRSFAPKEMLSRIPNARTAFEVDGVLKAMTDHFPEAPETREAYELAVARYGDKRLMERAAPFLTPATS
ncbi:MAG: hypothetical protein ACI9MR_002174 [Myxococcota bacterium]|jgi:hypothetical protein